MKNKKPIRNHPLIESLISLKGNQRACIYVEPLFAIPFNLYSPFVSVYMAALLLTDKQIGLIASVNMLFRAVFALLGGAITDKLGRKKTTFIFDMCSWSVPCLLWAFSQNIWWFMIAAAFNGIYQITENSWSCLLVEDADKGEIVKIFSLIHLAGQLAVIITPLAAILINSLTIVPAMRIVFLFSFLSMTAKFVLLYLFSEETQTGIIRKQETSQMPILKIIRGYGRVFLQIFSSPGMMLALVISTFFAITTMIMTNFFGLYATENLLIPQQFLAYYPIVRSVIITLFFFVIQPKINRFGLRVPMLAGILLYALSHIVLLLAPVGNLAMPIGYVIFEACAYSLVLPRRDTIMALLVDPAERARINGIITTMTLGASIPFGYLSGWLSDTDRDATFILDIVIFALAFAVIAANRKLLKDEAY